MSALFSPGHIGPLALDNRIVVSPMCQYSAVNGTAQPWHLIHIGNLMMSGAGLVIMEATAVEEVGRGTHGCLGLYTDEHERALADIVREAKKLSSAKLGIQLTHSGRKASTRTIPEAGRASLCRTTKARGRQLRRPHWLSTNTGRRRMHSTRSVSRASSRRLRNPRGARSMPAST